VLSVKQGRRQVSLFGVGNRKWGTAFNATLKDSSSLLMNGDGVTGTIYSPAGCVPASTYLNNWEVD